MKYYLAAMVTLGLGACAGEPTSQQICSTMIEGDAEVAEDIRRDGIEPAALCECIGTTMDAMSADEKATHIAVMTTVTKLREAQTIGVEQAAELLEDQLRAGTGGHAFTEDAFEKTGRLLNDVGNQLEDGACSTG